MVELHPAWPMPGPNGVRRLRCTPERLPAVVAEVRALARSHGVGLVWTLDEESIHLQPELLALNIVLDTEVAVLLLEDDVKAPTIAGLELLDGLASLDAYRVHHATVAAGFPARPDLALEGDIVERYRLAMSRHDSRLVTARFNGEYAGGGSVRLLPDGARLGGGSVKPEFRGRGIYRALVAARVRIARDAGLTAVATDARPTSKPILLQIGFRQVGRWWGYRDLEVMGPI